MTRAKKIGLSLLIFIEMLARETGRLYSARDPIQICSSPPPTPTRILADLARDPSQTFGTVVGKIVNNVVERARERERKKGKISAGSEPMSIDILGRYGSQPFVAGCGGSGPRLQIRMQ